MRVQASRLRDELASLKQEHAVLATDFEQVGPSLGSVMLSTSQQPVRSMLSVTKIAAPRPSYTKHAPACRSCFPSSWCPACTSSPCRSRTSRRHHGNSVALGLSNNDGMNAGLGHVG